MNFIACFWHTESNLHSWSKPNLPKVYYSFRYCLIWFVNILFTIFAYVFIGKIGLYLFFLEMPFSCFGFKIMLTSLELSPLSSFSGKVYINWHYMSTNKFDINILWNSLKKTPSPGVFLMRRFFNDGFNFFNSYGVIQSFSVSISLLISCIFRKICQFNLNF